MSMIRRTASLVGAAILVSVLAVPALAYNGEVPVNITVSGQVAGVTCGTAIPLSATVDGASGTGVPGVVVTWTIASSPSGANDKLGSASTTSGANGVATNTLTLSCVTGNRVVHASAQGGVLGAISINLSASGLPNTSTMPDGHTSPSLPAASLLFLAIAIGFGMALGVRRFRA
jgi:hypothetical protein